MESGLHAGECEVLDGKVGGIAVHIGARVAKKVGPGEVLVSTTVKDLVAGSGLQFQERGVAELKGVPCEAAVRGSTAGRRSPPADAVEARGTVLPPLGLVAKLGDKIDASDVWLFQNLFHT